MRKRSSRRAVIVWALALSAAAPSPAQQPSPGDGLKKGDAVDAFEADGIDGTRRRVDYSKGSATVLLFFNSGCPKCRQMLPLWSRAYEQRSPTVEVYGVILDQEPPGFFTATPVRFPVLRAGRTPAERKLLVDAFRVRAVPLVVRLRPGGRVEDVATGPVDLIRLGDFFQP